MSLDGVVSEFAELANGLRVGIDSPELAPLGGATSLLILDDCVGGQPLSWRDLVSLSWRLQEEAIVNPGHADHLQIVCFHPQASHSTYIDSGAPPDAADFAIRSPYPTVQLLREVDILKAVRSYPSAADIPARNRIRMRADGFAACEERLQSCSRDS